MPLKSSNSNKPKSKLKNFAPRLSECNMHSKSIKINQLQII
jgi:hypothetical protein